MVLNITPIKVYVKKEALYNYDPNKTEYEIMLEDGYARVWDCGNLIFEYNKA